MDYQYKEKIKNDSITIAIVYEKVNFNDAKLLKEKIYQKYKNGIKSYSLDIVLTQYNKAISADVNIYYLFPSNTKNIKRAVKQAQKTESITFSYLKDDLKNGVMLSLEIGQKVKPLLNLKATKLHNISFRPVLLNISNIYTENPTLSDTSNKTKRVI